MSSIKPYEELKSSDKMVNQMHLVGKMGVKFTRLAEAIQHQFDELIFSGLSGVRRETHVSTALGENLDELSSFFGLSRLSGEDDEDYRVRIVNYIKNYGAVSVDGIKDYFEFITGRRPYLREEFTVKVLSYGDVVDEGSGGKFVLVFELPVQLVHEELMVEPETSYVELGHETIISMEMTNSTSNLLVGVTTLNVVSTAEFPSVGELIVEEEWMSYSGKTATSFTGLIRGLYETTDVDHTGSPFVVTEGINNAWLVGAPSTVYDYTDGNKIYLKGGPYHVNTWVNLRYEVSLDSNYDEASELIAVINDFVQLSKEIAAAGIGVTASAGAILTSWAQTKKEILELVDSFDAATSLREMVEDLTLYKLLPQQSNPHVYCTGGQWGVDNWGTCFWDDGISPPSTGYFIECDANKEGL